MASRGTYSFIQEDQILQHLVASAGSEKLKWVEVAKVLHEKVGRLRTGKQCRERYYSTYLDGNIS
jgi:hypothetical protein